MSCRSLIVGALLLASFSVVAEDKKDHEAMMAAWQAAGTPGPAHAVLKTMAGTYSASVKMFDPGQPVQESQGTSDNKMILGERFFEQNFKGTAMGQPFEGRALYGFDNTTQKYQSVWIDSMGTVIHLSEGTADKSGKVLTFKGSMVDPLTKKSSKTRAVLTLVDPAKHTYESFITIKGKEVKNMEITYTKK